MVAGDLHLEVDNTRHEVSAVPSQSAPVASRWSQRRRLLVCSCLSAFGGLSAALLSDGAVQDPGRGISLRSGLSAALSSYFADSSQDAAFEREGGSWQPKEGNSSEPPKEGVEAANEILNFKPEGGGNALATLAAVVASGSTEPGLVPLGKDGRPRHRTHHGRHRPAANAGPAPRNDGGKLIFVNCVEDRKAARKYPVLNCPRHTCNLTSDKKDFDIADAAVFNPLWMAPHHVVPDAKPRAQRWVLSFQFESAKLHPTARFATSALGSRTDLTMTYMGKSDIFRPFHKLFPATGSQLPDKSTNFATGKRFLLLWFVSNCGSRARMELFRSLERLLGKDQVHMHGRCGTRKPVCKSAEDGDPCNIKWMSQYKFYAAFENSRCDGYITEKFFRGLKMSMVPLALGGLGRKDYENIISGESFLHVDDFPSVDALAKRLGEIDRDDAWYSKFHAWRLTHQVGTGRESFISAYCDLCERLHEGGKAASPKSYGPSLDKWMFGPCIRGEPKWKRGG